MGDLFDFQRAPRRRRYWDRNLLSLAAAQQDRIECGDLVRAYDRPGQRDDYYVEGIVTEVERGDLVKFHVVREVRRGVEEMVTRLNMVAPLGASLLSGAPCVFLQRKRDVVR